MLLYQIVQLCREVNSITGFPIGLLPYATGDFQLVSRLDPHTGRTRDEMFSLLSSKLPIQGINSYLRSAKGTILLRNEAASEMRTYRQGLPNDRV